MAPRSTQRGSGVPTRGARAAAPAPAKGRSGPKKRKAGRNLPQAISVGVGLCLILVASLAFNPWWFIALASLACGVAVFELRDVFRTIRVEVAAWTIAVGGALLLAAAYKWGPVAHLAGFGMLATATLGSVLVGTGRQVRRSMSVSIFTAFYVPFLAGFAALLAREPDGHWWVATFILTAAMSDTGGFIAGVLFGKHPMSPTVSPKKSWEGFAGSVIGSTLTGTLLVTYLLDSSPWVGALLGACTALTATLGDLGESLIKRDLGVKDMGSTLPGHGGVMDRLDSLLPTAPVAFLVLHYFVN